MAFTPHNGGNSQKNGNSFFNKSFVHSKLTFDKIFCEDKYFPVYANKCYSRTIKSRLKWKRMLRGECIYIQNYFLNG